MSLTQIRYEPYSEQRYTAVKALLSEDVNGGENIQRIIYRAPELFVTAYMGEKLVALAQMSKPGTQSYLTVFVSPSYRRQGIGTAMVKYAENKLRSGGTQMIRTSFRAGYSSSVAFARSLGYDPYFSSTLLERTDDPFSLDEVDLPVRPYNDEDYIAAQSMYAVAFHEMRVRTGCFPDSVIAQPSEQERLLWKKDERDHFVYVIDGEIVAYSHLSGNEISSVSVRTDFQRRGIGRKFVMYLCNEIIRRGHTTVALWCVVGNDARKLYDSLGFQQKYTMEFMRKALLH